MLKRDVKLQLTNYKFFCACCRGSVLLRHGDEIPRGKSNFGAFLSNDNALCSIAFATHTNTAESIEMPFGMMTRVGGRYHVLDGGPDPPRGRSNFGGCPGHSKALAILAAAVAAALAAKGIIHSSITSSSRRDHSVYQASVNRNPENYERRRCCLSAGNG